MMKNIINNKKIIGNGFDSIFICQDEKKHNIIRISWFKDCHFQDELYININKEKHNKPELRNRQDWYHAGEGVDIDVYFSFNNKLLSFDCWVNNYNEVFSRNYDLEELYEAAGKINA